MTKCEVCGNKFRSPTVEQHVHERSPDGSLCMGCYIAQTSLEMFHIRATSCPDNPAGEIGGMGPWARGWLKEILKEPRKYLTAYGARMKA